MARFRTIFYHGAMLFTGITMLLSGYHSFKNVDNLKKLLLPFVSTLIISIPTIIANTLIEGTDYLFFKLESLFFSQIGNALPDIVTIPLTYLIYLVIHCGPYLPSYLINSRLNNIKTT